MNPLALELPEDKTLWATWLDHQVVGPELRLLVRQWELLSNDISEPPSGESWDDRLLALYSGQLPEILARGLNALSLEDLDRFMRQPRLLLALQERVFIGGGSYWQNLARPADHSTDSTLRKSQVLAAIHGQGEPAVNRTEPHSSEPQTSQLREADNRHPAVSVSPATPIPAASARRSNLRTAIYLAALAASILVAAFYLQPKTQGRFFDRTGLMASTLEGPQFTKALALAIREDWDPDTPDAAFPGQLRTLRDSCELLLSADLHQVSPAVAEDLRTRCRKWQATLSDMLIALDDGRPVGQVRQEANQLVDRLVNVLNDLG